MSHWYLVRHAQTVWNRENRLQGGSDTPLSPLGLKQAEYLSRHFEPQPIRAIVSSGLQRSQDTARAIARGNGHRLTPVMEPGLSEIHLGEWEGMTPDEVNVKYDDAYTQWRVNPSRTRIPGAEPLDAFLRRVRDAKSRLLQTLGSDNIVIVTHGGVIAALLAEALRAEYDYLLQHLRLDNAGITAVAFAEDGTPFVSWINAISHLQGSDP